MTTAQLASTPAPSQRSRAAPVAVLLSRFPTITETFILREVDEMERQGQRVRLVPMLEEKKPPVIHEAALPWTSRALYTPYLSLSIAAANMRAFFRQPGRYLSVLGRVVAGTITRPGTLLRSVAVFPKSVSLAEQLSREGVRHVHAHFATHPSTMALIIASFSQITFSFTVHAHDIQIDRSLLGWKLQETRFVRSISDYNKRFLEGLYPQAQGKIMVVHVGIEPEKYEDNAHRFQATTSGIPRVLCVAAHRPYKGLPVLIEACGILRDQSVSFRCDVLGQGPMKEELEQLIRARGVENLIHLLGAKPEHVVAEMMGEATLFVLPSIIAADGQMEGIPVALMEAMASSRAVVSTSIAGIPELVETGVNGLLVPPGDAQALAAAMRSLLEDRDRAREMGRRGQEKVRAEFTLPECVSQLLARLDQEVRG